MAVRALARYPRPGKRTRYAARIFWPLAFCLCQLLPVRAQNLETIVVTGTRVPRAQAQPGSATLIDAATIRARNDANVFDLLSDTPGLYVRLPGGRANTGSIFIRGSEPNYGAVLIDGIQVNDPTNTRGGSFDFSTLDIDAIERIEILRAPQSPIYGSDALSGVINVITRTGSETLSGGADIELGTDAYSRAGVQLGGPAPGHSLFNIRLSGINEGSSSDPAEFRGHSFAGKLTSHPDEPVNFALFARHSAAKAAAFPDDSGGERLAILREKETRDTRDASLGLEIGRALTERTSLHVNASLFEHDEQVSSPGVAAGVRNGIPENTRDSGFSRRAVNVFLTTTLGDSLHAAYGIGYQQENGDAKSLIRFAPQFALPADYELGRDNVGIYGELDYRVGGLRVSPAFRADKTEDAGTVTTGKITLSYQLSARPTGFHLTFGEGFKLPSLFALADPLVGNATLEPETAD